LGATLRKEDKGYIVTHTHLPGLAIAVMPNVRRRVTLRISMVKKSEGKWVPISPIYEYSVSKLSSITSPRSNAYKTFFIAIVGTSPDLLLSEESFTAILNEMVMEIQQYDWEYDEAEIDLDAKPTRLIKPCGFYGDVIVEPIYVPQIRERVIIGRAVMIRTKEGFGIKPFREGMEINGFVISGMFPSSRMKTLPSKEVPKTIINHGKLIKFDKRLFRRIDKIIDDALKRHLFLDDYQRLLIKRFIEATYFYDMMEAFPILNIIGSSENGKTRALLCIGAMSYHGNFLVDPTEAVLFRVKEDTKPTMIIDEAEYLNDTETRLRIKLLLNASYSKDAGFVYRAERGSDGVFEPRSFDLYSPVAIAGISGLYGVLRSRSIPVVMPRANRDYPKAKEEDYRFLRDIMYVVRMLFGFKIKEIYDNIKENSFGGIDGRYFELFRPLILTSIIFGDEKELEMIIDIARQIQINERNEAETNINEEQMLLQVLDVIVQPTGSWYPLEAVIQQLQMPPHQVSWRPGKVSTVLRRMGIIRRQRIDGQTHFYTTREEVDGLLYRYGVKMSDGGD